MWYTLKLYIRDWWISIPSLCSLLLIGCTWWYVASHIHPIEGGVFLHYDVVIGPNLQGEWWQLYYFPGASSSMWVVNQLLAYLFYAADRVLGRVLVISSLLLTIFLFIAVFLMIGINF